MYDRDYYLRHHSYAGSPTEVALNKFRAGLLDLAMMRSPTFGKLAGGWNVVDYGCSHGAFLKEIQADEAFNAYGVEINPYCVGHCTKAGYMVFTPEMFEYFCENLKVGCMTFWDVFEHIPHPASILDRFKPQTICLSLPCLDGWLESHPGKDIQLWKHFRPTEHIWCFKHDDFVEYLEQAGYYVAYSTFDESKIRVDKSIGEKNIMSFVAVRK